MAVNQIKAMLLLAELVEHPGITSLYLPVEDFAPQDQIYFTDEFQEIMGELD